MVLIKLFLAFLKIGLFAIGGAYSFLPLIEREVVERHHWLTNEEFLDILGAVNVLPGAISIKFATYTGYKIAGIPGLLVANLGNFLGPAVLVIFACILYTRYKNLSAVKGAFDTIQLAVFAMIVAVAFRLISLNQVLHLRGLLIVVVSFFLFFHTKIHPAFVIITAGIFGALFSPQTQ